ncbi:MAG: hypothetical protein FWH41_03460 [Treponema sp.]|nr:hypothetical protein [Treponema sp.]
MAQSYRFFRIKFTFFTFSLILICPSIFCQEITDGAYLLPSKVYVGDRASYVLPIPQFMGKEAYTLELPKDKFPQMPELDIHSIRLEGGPRGGRFVLEFTAFVPGIIQLPPIYLSSNILDSLTSESFDSLAIEISSILDMDNSDLVLSGPALPLAIPGTSLFIFSVIGTILLLLVLSLWISLRGRKKIRIWAAAWQRRKLFASMLKTEKRLRKALACETEIRFILDALSAEFRRFLSGLTGENCTAMTAGEIGLLEPLSQAPNVPGSSFLKKMFSNCDTVRFSGGKISAHAALEMLDGVKNYIAVLKSAERKFALQKQHSTEELPHELSG